MLSAPLQRSWDRILFFLGDVLLQFPFKLLILGGEMGNSLVLFDCCLGQHHDCLLLLILFFGGRLFGLHLHSLQSFRVVIRNEVSETLDHLLGLHDALSDLLRPFLSFFVGFVQFFVSEPNEEFLTEIVFGQVYKTLSDQVLFGFAQLTNLCGEVLVRFVVLSFKQAVVDEECLLGHD